VRPTGTLALSVALAGLLTSTIAFLGETPAPQPVVTGEMRSLPHVSGAPEFFQFSEIVVIEGVPTNLVIRRDVVALSGRGRGDYFTYEFSGDGAVFIARAYADEPRVAYLLGKRTPDDESLGPHDFRTRTLREAIAWLRSQGRTELSWLSDASAAGFERLPEVE
jgi:hypothetical protein